MKMMLSGIARLLLFGMGMTQVGCVPGVIDGKKSQGVTVRKNIIYTPDGWNEQIKGDFYYPKNTPDQKSVPVVLLVHGGSWAENDNRYQMKPIAKTLAKNGYAVFNVTYRLAPQYHFPAPVDDLYEAVKWLKTNAGELNIDMARAAVFGYSAGGQLVEMLAMREMPDGVNLRAVVAGGSPHFLRLDPDFPVVRDLIGKSFKDDPEAYYAATPVDMVSKDFPPIFIYHGSADELVPPVHTDKMIARLKQLGVEHEVYWVEGRGHAGAFILPQGSVSGAVRFLDNKLK